MEDSQQVLAYTRNCPEETLLVIANKSDEPAEITLPEHLQKEVWKPVLMNYPEAVPAPDAPLAPWECRIYSRK
jgi:hypothetical protein